MNTDVHKYVEHFRARVLQDALAEATATYWRRRAVTLRVARPRPEDFHDHATREELDDRWHRLTATADACDRRASIALRGELE